MNQKNILRYWKKLGDEKSQEDFQDLQVNYINLQSKGNIIKGISGEMVTINYSNQKQSSFVHFDIETPLVRYLYNESSFIYNLDIKLEYSTGKVQKTVVIKRFYLDWR